MIPDSRAQAILDAAVNLATVLRDETGDSVLAAAEAVLKAAEGDPVAAVAVVASLVRVDMPVDPWWMQPGLDKLPPRPEPELSPCGTHAAFIRHRKRGEPIDDACRDGEREYQRGRKRICRARASQADGIDEIAVERAASGDTDVDLTSAEKLLVVERMLTRGVAHSVIARCVRLSYTRVAEIAQGAGVAA